MPQHISTATAEAPPAKALDIQLFEHPTRPDLRGIEFHFPAEPPQDIKDLLLANGFKFLGRRSGQWVPRWYRVQSAESWAFAQKFCAEQSDRFGPPQEIPDDCIPEEFRHAPASTPEATASAPGSPYPAPEEAIPPAPPRAEVPASITQMVLDSAIAHLDTPSDSVSYEVVASDIFGADEPDAKARERLTYVLGHLVNTHQLVFHADDTYSLPAPSLPDLPAQVEPEPTVDVVTMPKPSPDPFADIFGAVDAIAAFAQVVVAEAERKVELTLWRPEWPGGLYRLFRFRLATSLNTMQAALDLAACAEDVTAKKTKPAQSTPSPAPVIQPEQRIPSLPEPSLSDTEPSAPSVPIHQPAATAPKTRRSRAKTKIRSVTRRPQIEGDPIFLDDDDLRETEPFIGCYAVLKGQIGLSFKGLVDPLTFMAAQPYTAKPGTFQPLSLPEFAAERLRALIQLWESYIELVDLEAEPGQADEFVESRRAALNQAYDQFVLKHGSITSNEKLTHFYGITDTRLSLLRSLEVEDPETGEIQKARLFFQRCVSPAAPIKGKVYFQENLGDRCADALARCMDIRGGKLDIALIATMTGLDPTAVEEQLLHDKRIFRDPEITGGHRGHL